MNGEMNVRKMPCVIGTFDENTFQLSLEPSSGETIPVRLMEPLGLQCVPLLGHYGEEYFPNSPPVGEKRLIGHFVQSLNQCVSRNSAII
jgi:hypothetical protein